MIKVEEREIITEEEKVENVLENDKGFAFAYNLTMVSAIATVAIFVIGTALYLTIAG